MSGWRNWLIHVTPGNLMGIRYATWMRLLRENHFDVDLPYWPRAAFITCFSLINTVLGRREQRLYGDRIAGTKVPKPLFVLGLARSGTTFLQQLLSLDQHFAFPNMFQTRFPHIFLGHEVTLTRWTKQLFGSQRLQDNVAISWQAPAEEEALAVMTLYSTRCASFFPRNQRTYLIYDTFAEAPPAIRAEWQKAFYAFLQKVTFKYQRPLILKNPSHTGRIKILLDLFPDARFVLVHRHPYDTLRSFIYTNQTIAAYTRLQVCPDFDATEWSIQRYTRAARAYFAEQHLLPPGRLSTIRFQDLERDPLAVVERIYQDLTLPECSAVKSGVAGYVERIRNYRKNEYAAPPDHLKRRLQSECGQVFEQWGYSP
jgi:omega-hydroxy-beta-dihydromenaquinone-9 sulfotransferase